MTRPKIAAAIATCIFPFGLKRLLTGIFSDTIYMPDKIFIGMDGNEGYLRLDQMEKYKERFSHQDPGADNLTDTERLVRDNKDVQDYLFLKDYESNPIVEIIRNKENLGGVPNFNMLLQKCYEYDFTVLLMDDEYVKTGWLLYLRDFMLTYPNVALSGYSNIMSGGEPAFSDIEQFDDIFSCLVYRGVYLRDLIQMQGSAIDSKLKMLGGDVVLYYGTRYRGHDIGMIAQPRLVGSDAHHKSLGKWQFDNITQDKKIFDEIRDNDYGRKVRGLPEGKNVFVKMDGDCKIIAERTQT